MWIECTDKHTRKKIGVNLGKALHIRPHEGNGTEVVFTMDPEGQRWITIEESFDWLIQRLPRAHT